MPIEPVGFAELYRRHAQDVFRFALYLSANRALAEDVAAETFVRAFSGGPPVRTATAKAYLLAIARNLVLEEMRRGWRRADLDEEAAAAVPDEGPGPEEAARQRQRLGRVLAAMQDLPEPDRAALLMRAQDGLPYEEIAAALGLSLAAVKVKIHLARLRLARHAEG